MTLRKRLVGCWINPSFCITSSWVAGKSFAGIGLQVLEGFAFLSPPFLDYLMYTPLPAGVSWSRVYITFAFGFAKQPIIEW